LDSDYVTNLLAPPAWHDLAACRGLDPELFYPDRGASTRGAKACCGHCIVRECCLEYASPTATSSGSGAPNPSASGAKSDAPAETSTNRDPRRAGPLLRRRRRREVITASLVFLHWYSDDQAEQWIVQHEPNPADKPA
jgi:hypothetical protein